MSYQTYHTLSIEPDDGTLATHERQLGEISGYDEALFEEEFKWYESNEDMLTYSKRYPDTTFILDGVGEENGDIWRRWYKNGKVQGWGLNYEIPSKPPVEDWDKVE